MKELTAKEIKEGMTQGKWLFTRYGDGQYSLHLDDAYYEQSMPDLEDVANEHAITNAVNSTYKKGLDPEKMEEGYKILFDLRKEVNLDDYPELTRRIGLFLESARIK